ncbi:hypothetical protein EDF57_103588 [Novosphingobium sp. PhB55]|uniref:hypothetical protein n=1 Tax=Novosphingobium sp. PhB55 TaxID=2485106 RepID=UPI0010658188|nr:hypothetical protein [Novosphingobium sp. PhB55]TDW65404.1 hypothetical protein EDF57_103588 [Novosphingobium sp. PhB55]
MILALAGGLFAVLASMLLYLASANQRWGDLPFPPRLAGWSGLAFMVTATVMMLRWAGAATAIFIVATLAMTVWSVVPLAIAWWRHEPEGRK